jgi:hypothetical protein
LCLGGRVGLCRLFGKELVIYIWRDAVLFFGRLIASREKTRKSIELARISTGALSASWAPEGIHVHTFLFGTILLLGNVLRGFCWIGVTVGVHFSFLDELCFLIGDERRLF